MDLDEINKKLDKSILNSYKYLKKYTKKTKFNPKKNNNFIHLFLLYIQNKFNLKFNLNV